MLSPGRRDLDANSAAGLWATAHASPAAASAASKTAKSQVRDFQLLAVANHDCKSGVIGELQGKGGARSQRTQPNLQLQAKRHSCLRIDPQLSALDLEPFHLRLQFDLHCLLRLDLRDPNYAGLAEKPLQSQRITALQLLPEASQATTASSPAGRRRVHDGTVLFHSQNLAPELIGSPVVLPLPDLRFSTSPRTFDAGLAGHLDGIARIDHRFGNEGDFGRPERFSESFAIDPVQVE